MKMVSAAKLRRAQDAITQMRPYAQKLQEILSNVSGSLDSSENVYAAERSTGKVLVVAITSNRGLAGAFNTNIMKAVRPIIESHKDATVEVLSMGKKAVDFYTKRDMDISTRHPLAGAAAFNELNFNNVSEVAQMAMDAFVDEEYKKVYLVYNSFRNAAVQNVQTEQFLPIEAPEGAEESTADVEYIFEPSKQEIVKELIPQSLKIQFYKAMLDSHAGEHGARMTAMHKATDNAGDLIKELKLTYNKARQAAITAEILEIVGGAEALNN